MENFFKINEQCLQNLGGVNDLLAQVETKGDSTLIIYKARLMLIATLEQLQKDNQNENQQEEQPIVVNQKNDKK
jgi:hypothetical protein